MYAQLLLQPDGSPGRYFKLSAQKKKFWRVLLLLLCVLGSILAWLAFGERGLIPLYRTEIEREACIDRIRQLAEENQTLVEEIHRLNTDMDYVESVVRKEFNLIKENEIIYRFNKDKASHNGNVKMPLEARHENESRRSATKVGHNEKIK